MQLQNVAGSCVLADVLRRLGGVCGMCIFDLYACRVNIVDLAINCHRIRPALPG